MTKGDGKPCERCGTSEWYRGGNCVQCQRECSRRLAAENPERNRERSRRWAVENPERVSEHKLRWQKNNPKKVSGYALRWAASNPAKVRAIVNRRRTRETQAGGSYTAGEFKQLCEQYDNRCLRCGQKKKLTFDHVIPVSKGGTSDISNGQPLCLTCNISKGNKTTDYRTKPGILRWIQKKLL